MTRSIKSSGAVLSLILSDVGARPNLVRLEGFMNGSAASMYYLHLYAATALSALSNGASPLYSVQVDGQRGFTFDYSQKPLITANLASALPTNGNLLLVVSTTEATLTKATTETVDVRVEIESAAFPLPASATVEGDLTTAVVGRGHDGAANLLRVEGKNNNGVDVYLQIHDQTDLGLEDGQTPVVTQLVAAGATFDLSFGRDGLRFATGIQVIFSSTAATLTSLGGTDYTVRLTRN